jgi:hypothetical protein
MRLSTRISAETVMGLTVVYCINAFGKGGDTDKNEDGISKSLLQEVLRPSHQ